MTYSTGSIVSATPGNALLAVIDPIMIAHPAWEFVETVTSGDYTANVYRCLGTQNEWGDFYVALGYNNVTLKFFFALGEGWDTGTKKLTKPATASGSTSATPDADKSYPTPRSPVTENYLVTTANGNLFPGALGMNTTGFEYWFLVTTHTVVMATRRGTSQNGPTYVGLYDSFHSLANDPAPLVIVGPSAGPDEALTLSNTANTGIFGARTRALGWASGAATYLWNEAVGGPIGLTRPPILNGLGSLNKERISDSHLLSKLYLHAKPNTTSHVRAGAVSGELKSHFRMTDLTAVENMGDTAGDWVCVGNQSGTLMIDTTAS